MLNTARCGLKASLISPCRTASAEILRRERYDTLATREKFVDDSLGHLLTSTRYARRLVVEHGHRDHLDPGGQMRGSSRNTVATRGNEYGHKAAEA